MLRSKKNILLQIPKSFEISSYLMYADDYEGNLHFLKLCFSWLFFPPRGGTWVLEKICPRSGQFEQISQRNIKDGGTMQNHKQ